MAGQDLGTAAFITVADALPRDTRPDTERREICDTLVFVKAIANPKPVLKAVWRTTALGVYETYVNGVADSAQVLKPGFTHAAKRRQESVREIGDELRKGAGETNIFAARVTPGWYRDRIVGGHPGVNDTSAFRGVLELFFADGTTETLGTDTSWKAAHAGRVIHADIYYGETYDARVAENFLTAPAASEGWANAVVDHSFGGEVSPMAGAGVCSREDLALHPVAAYVWKGVDGASETDRFGRVRKCRAYGAGETIALEPGETLVVDFGQNASAVPDFRFSAATGTRLTVNFGEMLNEGDGDRARGNDGPGGSVYLANMRSCPSQLDYTFAGAAGGESFRPGFSFWGYRYLTARATASVTFGAILSVPVTSIGAEMERGRVKTGVAAVDQLISNARWGMLSNYLSIPTDCPQRDERQGWTADTQVFTRTALYFADVYPFLGKWMRDIADTQQADGTVKCVAPSLSGWKDASADQIPLIGWSDAAVIVPYECWKMSGDLAIARDNWTVMARFVERIASDGYATPPGQHQCGDWLSDEKWESYKENVWAGGPGWEGGHEDYHVWWDFLGGCFILGDARMMSEMAAALGRGDDRARYDRLAEETLVRLRRDFMTPGGDLREDFRGQQTAHLFALKAGLAPCDAARRKIRDRLLTLLRARGNRLATGFLGTAIIMDVLTENGAADAAYALLLQHECPGWLYSVAQGATTIWERWNGFTRENGFGPVAMNSFNHYAYGAVIAWIYGTAAGIRPGPGGGFSNFVLAPVPDRRLGSVEASFRTPNGEIRSAWKYEGDVCRWTFTIPEGTAATVQVNGGSRTYPAGAYELEIAP